MTQPRSEGEKLLDAARYFCRGEIRARSQRIEALTEKARGGDFEAFQERQKLLSRDPVDIGIEWQQFQQGESR